MHKRQVIRLNFYCRQSVVFFWHIYLSIHILTRCRKYSHVLGKYMAKINNDVTQHTSPPKVISESVTEPMDFVESYLGLFRYLKNQFLHHFFATLKYQTYF